MYWNSLFSVAVFGLTFFFMIRNGSLDEGYASTQEVRKDSPAR